MSIGRNRALRGMAMAAIILAGGFPSAAQEEWRSISSLIGESKYGEDFQHYDYVNPDAPKGGTLNVIVSGTFDSFNPYIVRGAPAAGLTSFGGGLLYDTLMEQSVDEPSTSHALLAEAFKYPDDYSSATYRLNPDARWHDGKPITAEDVVWSFNMLKEHSQLYNRYYANVTEAVALNEHEVQFNFDQSGNRELPHIMGDLAVLPKHWWEGTDAEGNKRDITQPTLEPPLGSGAYKIASFTPGSEIVWERVEDYWGADLPVKVGRENYDTRRYVYIQDQNAAWQAFTKGGLEDVRFELSSRRWATSYDFPAFESGAVIKKEFPTDRIEPMQAFVFNMREPRFQGRAVRHALTLVYNFEEQNRTQFYGLNTRTDSYFENSELAATGLPQGQELEILEEHRAELPPELFTEEFKLPVYDTPQSERDYLREAVKLFAEAGWTIKGGQMVNEAGEQFQIQFLGSSPTSEIITGGYIADLRRIGIDASLRIVDPSQYINRTNSFEFDAVTGVFAQSQSPGNEQRDFWGSEAADMPGSRNLGGIEDPVVDALIDEIIFADDREHLVAATRALDRVLLWRYYMVPQYHRPVVWVAYWDKFGIPEKQPSYVGVDLDSWWVEPDKETEIEQQFEAETE